MEIFFLFVILFCGISALAILIPLRRKHTQTVREALNCDGSMQHFVFRVRISEDEVFQRLSVRNIKDELVCEPDPAHRRLRFFSDYGSSLDYTILFLPEADALVVRLDQIQAIAMRSSIPFKINPYMIEKLDAEIIPFFPRFDP